MVCAVWTTVRNFEQKHQLALFLGQKEHKKAADYDAAKNFKNEYTSLALLRHHHYNYAFDQRATN